MSATHRALACVAVKSRSTRSGAGRSPPARTVVRTSRGTGRRLQSRGSRPLLFLSGTGRHFSFRRVSRKLLIAGIPPVPIHYQTHSAHVYSVSLDELVLIAQVTYLATVSHGGDPEENAASSLVMIEHRGHCCTYPQTAETYSTMSLGGRIVTVRVVSSRERVAKRLSESLVSPLQDPIWDRIGAQSR